MVTYWAEGVQLCDYRPWDWDEFGEFADIHGAEEQKLWPEQVRIFLKKPRNHKAKNRKTAKGAVCLSANVIPASTARRV